MGRATASIDGLVNGSARQMANAARFMTEHGEHAKALELLEHSLSIKESWYATWVKANALSGSGDAKNAYKAMKEAKKLGERDGGFFYAERVDEALAEWPKK